MKIGRTRGACTWSPLAFSAASVAPCAALQRQGEKNISFFVLHCALASGRTTWALRAGADRTLPMSSLVRATVFLVLFY